MFDRDAFELNKRQKADSQTKDAKLKEIANRFLISSDKHDYSYQWTWLGLPIIQMPQDIVVTQEIIWATKPDLIIETGTAWGGSIVFYASLLELIGKGKVIGIDLNLADHVRNQIMNYSFSNRIVLYKGSSVDPNVFTKVTTHIGLNESVMVLLDSNHTHQHVLEELRLYAPLVTKGQYLIVCDTVVEAIPLQTHRPRHWGPGNNPRTALIAYLQESDRFECDEYLDSKLLLTHSPGGYNLCIKD